MNRTAVLTLVAVLVVGAYLAGYDAAQNPGEVPPLVTTVEHSSNPEAIEPIVTVTEDPVPDSGENVIQLALLLDTSGSMSGLIDQARTQLWRIVNEFSEANRNGQAPKIQVALYEYGKSSLPGRQGYLRQIVPFTTDLDRVSEELFALQTDGGDEYCGWVMQSALDELDWSRQKGALRFIFVAGNEPFDQGPVDYREICGRALQEGIAVNTIFCGGKDEGERTGWRDGASMAKGRYLAIDHNQVIVHIEAPQDAEITRLGAELNSTYVAYGVQGEQRRERQAAQDQASVRAGSMAGRSYTKATANYKNESWDLVDAAEQADFEVGALSEEELPEEMRGMSPEKREAYVQEKAQEREQIQERIKELHKQRSSYVEAKRKETAQDGEDTLDEAIVKTVREQASASGYQFGK